MLDSLLFAVSEKALGTATLAFFGLTVVGAYMLGPYNKLSGRNGAELPIKVLGNRPVLQIELSRRDTDLSAVLAAGDLKRNLRDARAGNTIDTFLFIPAYSGTLLFLGLLLARRDEAWRNFLLFVALLAVPTAGICDWLENAGISATLDHFESGGMPLTGDAVRISVPSLIKWWTLTFILIAYSVAIFHRIAAQDWIFILIGASSAILGLLTLLTLLRYGFARNAP
jgi:hypothetical protein